jgi:prepilin-type N-terminal cleavage/methylation domain-containing protein
MYNYLGVNMNNKGLTLIELIITISLIAIVAAISVPIVTNQISQAHLATAQSDARTAGLAIAGEVSRYYSFGINGGDILFNSGTGYIEFDPMVSAAPVAEGPGATRIVLSLSEGSTLNGSYGAGTDLKWCVAVTNNSQVAVMSDKGIDRNALGCSTNGNVLN